ncbi:MAG TPA: hypothetical protein VIB60_03495 [Methylomirabilota bacterium]|jgi:hypothetical protein
MHGDAAVARWLIVVRRDKPDLFRDLSTAFAEVPQMAVILDRRVRERRAERSPAAGGQRQAPRRAPLTAAELELWETIGFRLIPPAVLVFHDPARS